MSPMPRPSTPVSGPLWQSASGDGTPASPFVPVVTTPGGATPAASFSRPANTTAYTLGDVVANSATAGAVVPMAFAVAREPGGAARILAARLAKSGTAILSAQFRLHLFTAAPTVSQGDNGALGISVAAAAYLGAIDVTCDQAFAAGAAGRAAPAAGGCIVAACAAADTRIYGLIEARAGYAPASEETFTVTLELDRD